MPSGIVSGGKDGGPSGLRLDLYLEVETRVVKQALRAE